jgi:hypothetical protein
MLEVSGDDQVSNFSNLSFLVSGDKYFDSTMPRRLYPKREKNKEVRQRNKLSSHGIIC